MKRYAVRLYRAHDMDLLSLIGTTEFNFVKAIYCVLKAYVHNEVFVINIPRERDMAIPKYERKYQKNLILDETKDADVIELLESLNKGYRNSFIKNLLRLYIAFPISSEFLIEPSQINDFHKRNGMFRANRKVAEAASIKKKSSVDEFLDNLQSLPKEQDQQEEVISKKDVIKQEETKKRTSFVFDEPEEETNEEEKEEEVVSEDEQRELMQALLGM